MKKLLLVIAVVCLPQILWAQTFSLASYQWAPYIDKNSENEGLSIALIEAVFAKQGHEIKINHVPWARALDDLNKGQVDILPAVWFKAERLETMIFSEPYLYNRLVFVKAKGDPFEYQSLDDLDQKVVGVIREYAYDGKMLDYPNAIFSVSDSLIANLKKVASKRINLTVEDEYTIKAQANPQLLNQLEFVENALDETPLHLTCSKTNPKCPEIIEIFNQGVAAMQQTGELDALLNNVAK